MEVLKNATPDSGGDVMTSSNMTVNNVTYSRADLVAANDEKALTVIPVMVVLFVMILLGVLGNSLVCYIFCFRLRPSTQNYLIVYLAVFDLLSSTLAMPSGIIFMRHIIMFESEAACKIMRFINMFCVIGSVYTLVVIAVDRFRKVCRPLKGQLSVKHIKYSLIPINCIAIFYAVPTVFIYGLRKVESGVPGSPGTDCSPTDLTSFPLVYNVFLFMSFVVITTSLMVIYYRVLRETKRHTRYMKENPISLLTKSQPGHTKDLSHVANIVDLPSVSLSSEDSFLTYKMMHTLSETHKTVTKSVSEPAITINTDFLVDNNFETKSLRESHSEETLQVPSQGKELMGRNIKDGDINSEEKNVKKKVSFQLDPDTKIGIEKDTTRNQPSWTDDQMKEDSFQEDSHAKGHSSEKTELEVFAGDASSLKGDNCVQTERVNSLQSENSSTQTDTSLGPSPPESELCEVPLFHSETNDKMTSHLPSASPNDGSNDVTTTSENPSTSTSNPEVFCITHETTPPCQETNKYSFNKTKRFRSKTTTIFFLITLVFILSFLPHLCVRALTGVKKDFDAKLSGAGLVFYHICFRSYILNSVLNPFIYGALNAKFKKEVKRLARKVQMFCKRK